MANLLQHAFCSAGCKHPTEALAFRGRHTCLKRSKAQLYLFCTSTDLAACRLANAQRYLATCAVGLSGVIFGLIVIDNGASGAHTRSVLGLFSVPARWP